MEAAYNQLPNMSLQAFPLEPFLVSLAADGIRLTVRDYERINRLMDKEGEWTLYQFRDALAALLAKDEEQQLRFMRRFDEFLQAPVGAEDKFPDIDLEAALNDLKRVAKNNSEKVASPSKRPKTITKPKTSPRQTLWEKLPWWEIAFGLLSLLMVASLLFLLRSPPVRMYLDRDDIQFGGHPVGSEKEETFSITNTGREPISFVIALTGDHSDFFEWECELEPPLQPGETRPVQVRYLPTEIESHNAEVVIEAKEHNYEKRLPLTGAGLAAQTEANPVNPEPTISPPVQRNPRWRIFAGIGGFLFFGSLLYGLYLYRTHRAPQDKPPLWDKNGPRHFPLGSIGGELAPWLTEEMLDFLADTTGYFQTRRTGHHLNVAASIRATLNRGGLPDLIFHRHREMRSLLILEDSFAEATKWNFTAHELAVGMRRRGIPVIFGHFQDTPERFLTDDDTVYHLEDLEDERRGLLLLVFTDGKGFYKPESNFVLEMIARWPMVAWMELRGIKFWDEITTLPAHYDIPVYPATPTGLKQALHRFLGEWGTMADYGYEAIHYRPAPVPVDNNLTVYLQSFLGDAYLWAADCAMIQPITLALADSLRREFHSNLPPERIEHLFAMPGTRHNISGLHFSKDVLKILRRSFINRRVEADQITVLKFIHERIEAAEPNVPKDSLAYLAWEVKSERLLLELNPDGDLQRLGELSYTPLKNCIVGSLEDYGFPEESGKVPLRAKPKNRNGLQRLARISRNFDIRQFNHYPISRDSWISLGSTFTLALLSMVIAIFTYTGIPFGDSDTPLTLTSVPLSNSDALLAATAVPQKVIFIDYTVQSTDTLINLARPIDTSIVLMAQYEISQEDIIEGNVIRLPVGNPEYCRGRPPYAVGEGDTANSIAQRFGISVEELQAINNLDAEFTVRAGDIICLSQNTATDPETSASLPVEISQVISAGTLAREAVEIRNTDDSQVSLLDWRLMDETGHSYTFGQVTLFGDGNSILVYTGNGVNSGTEVFWGENQAVWEPGELVTLLYPDGQIIDTYVIPDTLITTATLNIPTRTPAITMEDPPQRVVTMIATATMTPIPTIVSTPTLTPTIYPRIILVAEEVNSSQCQVTFRWEWKGILEDNMYYALRIGPLDQEPLSQAWTKATEYTLPYGTEFYPDNTAYNWYVTILVDSEGDVDGSNGGYDVLSSSETRTFRVTACDRNIGLEPTPPPVVP